MLIAVPVAAAVLSRMRTLFAPTDGCQCRTGPGDRGGIRQSQGSAVARVMVFSVVLKKVLSNRMTSAAGLLALASRIAWRNDPVPLSLAFVTLNVVGASTLNVPSVPACTASPEVAFHTSFASIVAVYAPTSAAVPYGGTQQVRRQRIGGYAQRLIAVGIGEADEAGVVGIAAGSGEADVRRSEGRGVDRVAAGGGVLHRETDRWPC